MTTAQLCRYFTTGPRSSISRLNVCPIAFSYHSDLRHKRLLNPFIRIIRYQHFIHPSAVIAIIWITHHCCRKFHGWCVLSSSTCSQCTGFWTNIAIPPYLYKRISPTAHSRNSHSQSNETIRPRQWDFSWRINKKPTASRKMRNSLNQSSAKFDTRICLDTYSNKACNFILIRAIPLTTHVKVPSYRASLYQRIQQQQYST